LISRLSAARRYLHAMAARSPSDRPRRLHRGIWDAQKYANGLIVSTRKW
jgi:hypothetical protein